MIDFKNLPKTVGIVGSRSFAKKEKSDKKMYDEVKRFVRKLDKKTLVVSGGAKGIDSYAEDVAKVRGMPTPVVFHPDTDLPVPYRFFKRNEDIVLKVADHQGVVIAFVDENNWRGTENTIKHCKRWEVPYLIMFYDSDGNYLRVEEDDRGLHSFNQS